MTVRGAPAIGVVAAFALVMAARHILEKYSSSKAAFSENQFQHQLATAANLLRNTRPTAVNLTWAIERILKKSRACNKKTTEFIIKVLESRSRIHFKEDIQINKKIGEWGSELIGDGFTILTIVMQVLWLQRATELRWELLEAPITREKNKNIRRRDRGPSFRALA